MLFEALEEEEEEEEEKEEEDEATYVPDWQPIFPLGPKASRTNRRRRTRRFVNESQYFFLIPGTKRPKGGGGQGGSLMKANVSF